MDQQHRMIRPTNRSEPTMGRPLAVIDDAATVLANTPEARRLMTELLLAGRRNGVQEQPEAATGPQPALWFRQYPTLAELEAAARRQ
ncbi:hypothetical protein ACQEVX_35630 [Streptomyces syringium]|uniref:hypothetical protein n=1 Tax=Streptomyces syringium TaxID=76729 RepID=UPI003D8CEFC4